MSTLTIMVFVYRILIYILKRSDHEFVVVLRHIYTRAYFTHIETIQSSALYFKFYLHLKRNNVIYKSGI